MSEPISASPELIDMETMPEEDPTALGLSPEVLDMTRRLNEIEDENTTLRENVEKLKNDVLYARADVENTRRRMETQLEERGRYAMTNFARDLLSVADNLRRALETVPAEKRSTDQFLDTLAAGVELTERELLNIFERYAIRAVEAMDQRFDPHLHQAMMEVENPDIPSGQVTMVMQTGYTIHDRLLRPAMVGVSKGGPKPEIATPETAN